MLLQWQSERQVREGIAESSFIFKHDTKGAQSIGAQVL